MTYTCNKKAYERFRGDCKKCPEYDNCFVGGKYCFVALAEMPTFAKGGLVSNDVAFSSMSGCTDTVLPNLRDTRKIEIKFGSDKVQVDRQEFAESFRNAMRKEIGMVGL